MGRVLREVALSAAALACPPCGAPLPVRAAGHARCGSCGAELSVVTGAPPRSVIAPSLDAAAAVAAACAGATHPFVDRACLDPRRFEAPRLAYAAFYLVDRGVQDGTKVVDTLTLAPAVALPLCALDAMPTGILRRPRQPFDPLTLARQAIVLDPSMTVEAAAPRESGQTTTDERVEIVYAPVWLLRCVFARDAYELYVDGVTGKLLSARLPVSPLKRLPLAIGIVYAVTILVTSLPWLTWVLLKVVTNMGLVGVMLLIFATGGLFTALGWAWERVRFRHELELEAGRARLVPVNRPEHTLIDRARDGFVRLVRMTGDW